MSLTPEGTYRAVVDSITVGESAKGTPQLVFAVNVHVTTSDVRRRNITLFLSDKALPYSEKTLADLGFNGDYENPCIKPEAYADGVEVYCKHEEYEANGERKMAERWNFSMPRAAVKPASDTVKATLAQRWRAQYGAAPVAVKPAAPAPTTPPPAPFQATKPPPPVTGIVMTKEKAWDKWAAEWGNTPTLNDMWTNIVLQIAAGRPESALTSKDWERVAEAAVNPLV